MASKKISRTPPKQDMIAYVVAQELPKNATGKAQQMLDDGFVVWGSPCFSQDPSGTNWNQVFVKYKEK
jgi:hypothetical protein